MTQLGKISKFSAGALKVIVIFLYLFVGISLRVGVATLGHNYDIESYIITARVVSEGDIVYYKTDRYNYGPAWFIILNQLSKIASLVGDSDYFRLIISIFLTLVDVAIFTLVLRRIPAYAAAIFLLNPISIIISGYHSQFDNLAILLGLIAILLYQKQNSPRYLAGLIFFGLSLIVKHILILFPIWLFFREKKLTPKLLSLSPIIMFMLSFIPFINKDITPIVTNVFSYSSKSNAPLLSMICGPDLCSPDLHKVVFILIVIFLGFILAKSKLSLLDLFLFYLATIVAFSSAIANQYLVIPVLFLIFHPNIFSYLYILFVSIFLIVDPAGLDIGNIAHIHIPPILYEINAYRVSVLLLILSMIYYVISAKRMREI